MNPENIVPEKPSFDDTLEFSLLEEDYQQRLGQDDDRNRLFQLAAQRQQSDAPPSLEERALARRLIRQYGFDLISARASTQQPVSGRLPGSYILGIGDELVVSFIGSTERTVTTRVDREGRLILPDLQPIPAAGRRFDAVEQDLRQRVSSDLLGTNVYISVGNVRTIGVFVLGEVASPGLKSLTSLSTVLDALAMAGGVKKTGSLRQILVQTGGETRHIDLYDMMMQGGGEDLSLADGARVVVPLLGNTIAVAGDVIRPAIYEMPPGSGEIDLSGAMAMAGGALRPRGIEMLVYRFDDSGEQQLVGVTLGRDRLLEGDILLVRPKSNATVGEVSAEGYVSVEGPRSIQGTTKLSDLLADGAGLGPDPYLPFGVIARSEPTTKARILKAVDLGRILAGAEDINLMDRDTLYVIGPEDLAFLQGSELRNVIISGTAPINACPALMAFAEYLDQTGRDRFLAATRSVFVASRETQRISSLEEGENSAEVAGVVGVSETKAPVQQEEDQTCSPLFDQYPQIIPFALEHAVSITGAVRRPGIYPVANQATLGSLIAVAGGFATTADPTTVEVLTFEGTSANTVGAAGRQIIDVTHTAMNTVDVVSGSSIRINNLVTDQERGTVLLTGEVRHPGVYSITRGQTLSELIDRAGGLTEYAYPYGAVLTRVDVKRDQQEAFRRTAREINSALAVAAVRSNTNADAIVAARDLARELATVEAAGRVVIEADPAVLRTRPELDTVLEPGDTLNFPKRPNHILVAGDVLNPGALQYVPGKDIKDYLKEAGGLQKSADDDRVFLVYPNGVAEPISLSRWSFASNDAPPGSMVVVPKNLNPFTTLDIVRDVSQILGQLALTAASLAVVVNN